MVILMFISSTIVKLLKTKSMKLSRAILLAGAGVAAGLWLTRTEKGKALRNDIARNAESWGKKISKISSNVKEEITDAAKGITQTARKAEKRV
jgi:hypothetical protein